MKRNEGANSTREICSSTLQCAICIMSKVTPTCGDDLKQLVPIPKGKHCNTFFLPQPLSRMSKCPFARGLRGDAFQFTVKSVHTVMALCTNIPIHSISSIYNSCRWSAGLCSFALISLHVFHKSNRWKYAFAENCCG